MNKVVAWITHILSNANKKETLVAEHMQFGARGGGLQPLCVLTLTVENLFEFFRVDISGVVLANVG